MATKNFYTFTFNSVQKMAKSDFSHWCEKYWIIPEWGTAQALKIGKIYCESDWILRPVNIKMTPAAIVCQLQRCHTLLVGHRHRKAHVHLYMCSSFLVSLPLLLSHQDASPCNWDILQNGTLSIDSQVTGGGDERSPSSARLTKYLSVCGRKHKT